MARATSPRALADVGVALGVEVGDQAGLAHLAVLGDGRLAGRGGAVEHFLAGLLALRQAGREQLVQRIGDDVRVLDVEDEADVADLLVARAVADVMQHQHVGDRQLRAAGGGHAANRPARERVPGDDQAELELRKLDALGRDEMRRRDDPRGLRPARRGAGRRLSDLGRHRYFLETLKTY
jgi:hypothetical protein